MKSNYKRIGDYIHKVEERNSDLKVTKLLGLSMTKEFRESTSNIIGTDMSVYKVVRKGQFACDFMSVIRVNKLPVVLKMDDEPILVSPAYPVFEVNDVNELDPEYLMMWFRRSEFDRYAVFKCDSAIRGGYDWTELCDSELPIPHIDKQKEVVKEYNVLVNRITLNNQLIKKLEETAQAIYKQWFVDFEFPDEEGKGYKSNGGEMVESEMGEIPKSWTIGKLKEIAKFLQKKIPTNELTTKNYISTENMLPDRRGITEITELPMVNNVTQFNIGEILVSNIRPYFKKIWLSTFNGGCSNDVLCFSPIANVLPVHLYFMLERNTFFYYVMAGSNGVKMPRGDKEWIMLYPIVLANNKTLNEFNKILLPFLDFKNKKNSELLYLNQLLDILLLKLATI